MTCGPNERSARPLLRSWQRDSGIFSTTATGSTSCSRASSTRGFRASACTLVASITVSNPRARRFPTTYLSTSNASPVASWLFSSLLTSPRQKSEEITSVGLKCFRANVDLPHPLGPIRTTRQSSGMVNDSDNAKYPHLRRRPDHRVLRPYRQKTNAIVEARCHGRRPILKLGPRPFESVIAMTELAGRQRFKKDVVFHVRRRNDYRFRTGKLE